VFANGTNQHPCPISSQLPSSKMWALFMTLPLCTIASGVNRFTRFARPSPRLVGLPFNRRPRRFIAMLGKFADALRGDILKTRTSGYDIAFDPRHHGGTSRK